MTGGDGDSFSDLLGNNSTQSSVKAWSVGALLRAIRLSLETGFNPVTVIGEISGFSRASSGHCYFSVKDTEGQVRCAMFRRAAGLLDFLPADGLKVEIRGSLGVYESKGDLQLIVESMRMAGAGNLYEQFLRLKTKLESEGLFAAESKRQLKIMPRAIGLITSLGGAALHDVATTLMRRAPHIPVVIYPALVQGALAPSELCSALGLAFERCEEDQIDVLLLVRGGGSFEDLCAFNDEKLVRLLAISPVPTVTGIGHETDFTLADFCADVRAATPTAAAEQSAQSKLSGLLDVSSAEEKMQKTIKGHLQTHNQRLDWANAQIGKPSFLLGGLLNRLSQNHQTLKHLFEYQLKSQKHQLDNFKGNFDRVFNQYLLGQEMRVEQAHMRMEPLNPELVLQRGFAWVADAKTGHPVTQAKKTKPSQTLRLQFSDGEVPVKTSRAHLSIDKFLQSDSQL